jgi:hypothetical protein
MKVIDELEERMVSWDRENQREICPSLKDELTPSVKENAVP